MWRNERNYYMLILLRILFVVSSKCDLCSTFVSALLCYLLLNHAITSPDWILLWRWKPGLHIPSPLLHFQMYPSIQAKIWGNLGQVSDLLDMVLDSFIKRSVTGGLGSVQAEIMADTAVALASANVQLVSRKVIGRLCRVGVKVSIPNEAYARQWTWSSLVQAMAGHLFGAKPLPEPMLTHY